MDSRKEKPKFWTKWIEQPPKFFRRLYYHGVFRIREEQDNPRTVYLTFDDGPIPETTPWVLDTLDRYGIKATFFMVGDNVRKNPGLYREVLRRGHAVGNHTMHHLRGSRVNTVKYLTDVHECAQWIDSTLFRPPHGWMRFPQTELINLNFRIVYFDVVTRDYSMLLSPQEVFDNVKRYTRPGSIVVFHDSIRSEPRLREALPKSIEWLLERGYEFRLIEGKKKKKQS